MHQDFEKNASVIDIDWNINCSGHPRQPSVSGLFPIFVKHFLICHDHEIFNPLACLAQIFYLVLCSNQPDLLGSTLQYHSKNNPSHKNFEAMK